MALERRRDGEDTPLNNFGKWGTDKLGQEVKCLWRIFAV